MASFTVPCPRTASTSVSPIGLASNQFQHQKQLCFQHGLNASPSAAISFSTSQCHIKKQSPVWKVQANLNQVAAEKYSNSIPIPATKSDVGSPEMKDGSAEKVVEKKNIPDAASMSAFMAQVSDLVKLVDSRDIMELQLKQLDCEVIIRKKEALEQPAQQVPYPTMPAPYPQAMFSAPPPPAPAAAPAPPAPAPAAAPAKSSQSSHPPLKCPMAGTFYRCPGPGEPPFIKVGDKVQKGQVICIIEAMKLMNDIEADQSGTVTEVLAEDGKPVSVDTPLFVIVP
ncbi:hypothetical protein UlMin_014631 [Ulmus minor]